METKVGIFGGGFVGRQVAYEFQKAGFHDFELFDFSRNRSGAPSVSVVATPNSIFAPEQLEKTANDSGGIFAWGGQLSMASRFNIFRGGDAEWIKHGEQTLKLLDFQEYFGNYRPETKGSLLVRNLALGLHFRRHGLRIEPGSYSSPSRKGYGPIKVPRSFDAAVKVRRAELISLHKDPYGRISAKVFDLDLQREAQWTFGTVVLASGTFLNAGLVNLLEGHTEFSIGNHPSRIAGIMHFTRRRWMGNLVQEIRPHERGFTTFSLDVDGSSNSAEGDPTQAMGSCRLTPIFPDTGQRRLETLIDRLFLKLRCFRALGISEYVAQELDHENYLKVVGFSAGVFQFELRLELTESQVIAARNLVNSVVMALRPKSFIGGQLSTYLDGAHYFGTLPVGDEKNGFLVSANMSLHSSPRVKVGGLSTLRRIGGIHPPASLLLKEDSLPKTY